MNVQRRREFKQTKATRTKAETSRKKKNKEISGKIKSTLTTIFIWSLVIVNLFLIASFVSRFWKVPGNKELAITPDGELQVDEPNAAPRVQVEVLNGCGIPGVAKKITNHLRDKGFDVVNVDNYESFNIEETYVIDRRSLDKIYATEVAQTLGIKLETGVAAFLSKDKLLDVSVIIGHDYQKIYNFIDKK